MIVVMDTFEIAPEIGPLWRTYSAQLHETFVRWSIHVRSRSEARPASKIRGSGSGTIETPTLEDAVATILALRQRDENARPSGAMRTVRPSSTQTLGLPEPLKNTK